MLTPLFPESSDKVIPLPSDHSSNDHFRTALILALVLHLMLATLLPPIDGLTVFPVSRDSGINVFLKIKEETKKFEQTLNQQLPLPHTDRPLIDPALGSASPELGEQTILTEETPESDSPRSESLESTPAGNQETASIRPAVSIDIAAVKIFAKNEAIRDAEQNPDEVARFKRSFNSRRNFQRRTRAESYKNQYGDYYIKTRSSAGDICFVQKQDSVPNQATTNTVYFFRCTEKPLKLDLDTVNDG